MSTATSAMPAQRLSRAALLRAGHPSPPAPTRILHLGLGAFHRAHQAWYTSHAADASQWGITALSGRSADLAQRLAPQDGLYTLVERGPHSDRMEIVTSIVAALPATDHDAFTRLVSAGDTSVITVTVTEAGYSLTPAGDLDLDDERLMSDLARVRDAAAHDRLRDARPLTLLGRLATGLELRRQVGSAPVALVSCDNLHANGLMLRRGVEQFAALALRGLTRSLDSLASFVSTSVDRITPRVTESLADEVRAETGWIDAAPVAAEPFSDWVLSGDFPAGRPQWESAGALFVDDVEPYELRKLWLLNGAHSILAYVGLVRGRRTIADAMADRQCVAAMERGGPKPPGTWTRACA